VTYILEKLYILAKFQIHFINFKFHFLSYDGVISEHDMKKLLRLFLFILPFFFNFGLYNFYFQEKRAESWGCLEMSAKKASENSGTF